MQAEHISYLNIILNIYIKNHIFVQKLQLPFELSEKLRQSFYQPLIWWYNLQTQFTILPSHSLSVPFNTRLAFYITKLVVLSGTEVWFLTLVSFHPYIPYWTYSPNITSMLDWTTRPCQTSVGLSWIWKIRLKTLCTKQMVLPTTHLQNRYLDKWRWSYKTTSP